MWVLKVLTMLAKQQMSDLIDATDTAGPAKSTIDRARKISIIGGPK